MSGEKRKSDLVLSNLQRPVVLEYLHIIRQFPEPDSVFFDVAQYTFPVFKQRYSILFRDREDVTGAAIEEVLFVDRNNLPERAQLHVLMCQVHGFVAQNRNVII